MDEIEKYWIDMNMKADFTANVNSKLNRTFKRKLTKGKCWFSNSC
jgi:hypothetical protein